MGKITDILAEVPLSVVLKERVAFEESKTAAIEKRLTEALAENEVLRDRLQKAEDEIRIFKERVHLFESGGDHPGYVVGS